METIIGSEYVYLYLYDDAAIATSEEFGLAAVEEITIGHKSKLEEPPFRVDDGKYKILRDAWENAMRAEVKGFLNLNTSKFVDVVSDDTNVVSA